MFVEMYVYNGDKLAQINAQAFSYHLLNTLAVMEQLTVNNCIKCQYMLYCFMELGFILFSV